MLKSRPLVSNAKSCTVLSLGLAMLLLGASATASNADNLILNGSFETPTLEQGDAFDLNAASLPGWIVVGSNGTHVSLVGGPFVESVTRVVFIAWSGNGNQWVDLTGSLPGVDLLQHGSDSRNEGVAQVVATIAGDRYQLSYWIGNTDGGALLDMD